MDSLDNAAEIEQLAAGLRVTSPHVGESCRTEVEYAGQIVTPKQTAAANVQTTDLVRNSLTSCRKRLEAAAEKHRALAVMLVHRANFGNEPEPYDPEGKENQAHHQLNLARGPSCDTSLRTHSLYGKMFSGSSDTDYSEAVDEYNDAAAELGRLLDDLPQAVGQTLWQDWPHGFVKPEPADLWTNAVLELAWQKRPASRLNAERWAWHNNHKLKIADLPAMRTSDSPAIGMFSELIERVGDPPAFWYSWINNIWRASINAIDLLIPMLRDDDVANVVSELPLPAMIPVEQPAGGDGGGGEGQETPALPAEFAKLKDEVAALKRRKDPNPTPKEKQRNTRVTFIRPRVKRSETWMRIAEAWREKPPHDWNAQNLSDAMRLFWSRHGKD